MSVRSDGVVSLGGLHTVDHENADDNAVDQEECDLMKIKILLKKKFKLGSKFRSRLIRRR